MYTVLGITLVLALLLAINATATMIAAGFGRLFRPLLRKCSARTRAEILFVMRIGPPVLAIVVRYDAARSLILSPCSHSFASCTLSPAF